MAHISITQIANELNLSKSTVSRVFNRRVDSGIAPQTQQRVWDLIQKKGYAPNMSARALAGARTHVLGAMFINANNPFVSTFAAAAEILARDAGYNLLLCNTRGSIEREIDECNMMRQRGIDGLIIEHQGSPEHLIRMESEGYPFVLLDRCPEAPRLDYVTFDDVEGGRLAARALLDTGRKRIAYLGGTSCLANEDRLEGYRQALNEAGITPRPEWIVSVEDCDYNNPEFGRQLAGVLLDPAERPDGIFCFTDYLALGAIQAIQERGLRVPEDIAVIGCNNEFFCPWTSVPLASVQLDMNRLGQEAAKLLLEKIGNPGSHASRAIKIKPVVVPRLSLRRGN